MRLSFHSDPAGAATSPLTISELEVAGGALSCGLDRRCIALYGHDAWEYSGHSYTTVALLSGGCRLLLRITRELTIVSDPIEHFYFIGPTLSANGVAFAKYSESRGIWRGMVRPLWWRAMRIVSTEHVATFADDSQLIMVNPWESEPSTGGVYDQEAIRARNRLAV